MTLVLFEMSSSFEHLLLFLLCVIFLRLVIRHMSARKLTIHMQTSCLPLMFMAQEPQMPSRQERRNVSVVSTSQLSNLEADRCH